MHHHKNNSKYNIYYIIIRKDKDVTVIALNSIFALDIVN